MLALKTISAKIRNRDFTAAQVAAIFSMPGLEVNNLIDEIAPTGMATTGTGRRLVQYKGLVPLLLARDFISWGIKRDLRQQALSRSLRTTGKSINVPGTSLSVMVQSHRALVAKSIKALFEAEDAIACKPDVMQGEPCLKGTRIPAYLIAGIVDDAGIDAAKRTYPQLTKRQIEQASLYAKATPRRGRPKEVKMPPRSKAKKRKVLNA